MVPGGDYGFRPQVPANGSLTVDFALHFPGGAGNMNVPATLRLESEVVDAGGRAPTR